MVIHFVACGLPQASSMSPATALTITRGRDWNGRQGAGMALTSGLERSQRVRCGNGIDSSTSELSHRSLFLGASSGCGILERVGFGGQPRPSSGSSHSFQCKVLTRVVRGKRRLLVQAGSSMMVAMAVSLAAARAEEGAAKLELFENNLLIVGPGVLGTMVASEWIKDFPDTRVVGQTNTESSHERLKSMGVFPLVKDLARVEEQEKFPFVIFCAPPSGSSDYAAEVRLAAKRWSGVGSFIFTSSSGLYDVKDGGWCDENAPSVPRGRSARLDVLLAAEEEAIKAGGNVVRLAGLYTMDRGAHTFWLKQGSATSNPSSYMNLIHYEDAASLCKALLLARTRGQTFMGCDNHPLTRQELMDATIKSGKFQGEFKGFTGTEDDLGKRMCNDKTRALLRWQPKYTSFASFLGVA